jgi:hypothetical protein
VDHDRAVNSPGQACCFEGHVAAVLPTERAPSWRDKDAHVGLVQTKGACKVCAYTKGDLGARPNGEPARLPQSQGRPGLKRHVRDVRVV